jgi:hypothetical protein
MSSDSEHWKGRGVSKVPFGLKDGRLWFVNDVPTGLACGCQCPDPACGRPLIARNQPIPGRQRAYYFAHAGDPVACGGRESALHRMAKEILLQAPKLRLPALALSDEDHFETTTVALASEARAEVRLLDGQARSDVSVWLTLEDGMPLAELHIEVRVSHAVDALKASRVVGDGMTMLEIDLSKVCDELLQDRDAFSRCVLDEANNRTWVNLGNPALLSALLGREIVEIDTVEVCERRVPFKKGDGHWLNSQQTIRSIVAGREPWTAQIELESYLGDPEAHKDAHGKAMRYACSRSGPVDDPTDGRGWPLPYAPGLYVRSPIANQYKTRLRQLVTRPRCEEPQGELFQSHVCPRARSTNLTSGLSSMPGLPLGSTGAPAAGFPAPAERKEFP